MALSPFGACTYRSVARLGRAAMSRSINLNGTYVTIVDVRIVTWWSGTRYTYYEGRWVVL